MVKNLSLSLLALFVCSCGFYSVPPGYIDPEFQAYVTEYKKHKLYYSGVNKIKRLSITFKELPSNLDGECQILSFSNIITKKETMAYRQIFINKDHWQNYDYIEKTLLIYHELGHCDLGLDHSYENTIMNEYGIDVSVFVTDPVYYLDLLFTEGK